MSDMMTLGSIVAEEFSRDKVNLSESEKRRLADMIDAAYQRVPNVGFGVEYVQHLWKCIDDLRGFVSTPDGGQRLLTSLEREARGY